MVGLTFTAEPFEGLDEREQAIEIAPYHDLLWRSDMIEAGQMQFSLRDSMSLPGVLLDAIHIIQQAKAELKKTDGPG